MLLTKKTDLLALLHLPTMHGLLWQKRMRWVGHALRRADSDLSKVEVNKELALSLKPWTKCLLGDMKELNIKSIKVLEDISRKREEFRKRSSSAYDRFRDSICQKVPMSFLRSFLELILYFYSPNF
jgi:hypothetical protein